MDGTNLYPIGELTRRTGLLDRYWQLVWIINAWQVVPGLLPTHPWLARAVRGAREA